MRRGEQERHAEAHDLEHARRSRAAYRAEGRGAHRGDTDPPPAMNERAAA
jgi:hypothetical protein